MNIIESYLKILHRKRDEEELEEIDSKQLKKIAAMGGKVLDRVKQLRKIKQATIPSSSGSSRG